MCQKGLEPCLSQRKDMIFTGLGFFTLPPWIFPFPESLVTGLVLQVSKTKLGNNQVIPSQSTLVVIYINNKPMRKYLNFNSFVRVSIFTWYIFLWIYILNCVWDFLLYEWHFILHVNCVVLISIELHECEKFVWIFWKTWNIDAIDLKML